MSEIDLTIQKALERIVTALVSDADEDLSRLDMLEEAVSYAAIALGMSPPDHKALREQLDTVAVQVIADKLDADNLQLYQALLKDAEDDHVASVFATRDAKLSSKVAKVMEEHVKRADSTDYSVN